MVRLRSRACSKSRTSSTGPSRSPSLLAACGVWTTSWWRPDCSTGIDANMNNIKLVVSDMAGTTVQDTGEVARAFAAALGDHGIEASTEQINAVRGASKREAIATLVKQRYGQVEAARVEAVYASFKSQL